MAGAKRFNENPHKATEIKKNGTEYLGIDQDGESRVIAAEDLLTKSNVGLSSVDNTADIDKPVSTAQAQADEQRIPKTPGYENRVPLFNASGALKDSTYDISEILKKEDLVNNYHDDSERRPASASQTSRLKTAIDTLIEGSEIDPGKDIEIIDARASKYSGNRWPTLGERLDSMEQDLDAVAALDSSKYYGLRMYADNGDFERTGLAVGKTFRRQNGAVDPLEISDFDFEAPWGDIKTIIVSEDGEILSKYGDVDFGEQDGEWMVYVPRVYTGIISEMHNGRPSVHHIVSAAPLPQLRATGFYGTEGQLLKGVMVGSTSLGTIDGVGYHSGPDLPPRVGMSITNFTNNISNKSQILNWYIMDHAIHAALTILMFVEIGHTNVKAYIGNGIQSGMPYSGTNESWALQEDLVDGNEVIVPEQSSYKIGMLVQVGSAYSNQSRAANRYIEDIVDNEDGTLTLTLSGESFSAAAGSTVVTWGQPVPKQQMLDMGNRSGFITQFDSSTRSHACYRGIWDLWGNVYNWLGGILRNDMAIWLSYNRAKNNIFTKVGIEGDSDWFYSGSTPNVANGYQKFRTPRQWDKGFSYLPEETGGGASATSWLSAYLYYFNDGYMGMRAVISGGAWNTGAGVSPLYWYGNISPTDTHISFGARAVIELIA